MLERGACRACAVVPFARPCPACSRVRIVGYEDQVLHLTVDPFAGAKPESAAEEIAFAGTTGRDESSRVLRDVEPEDAVVACVEMDVALTAFAYLRWVLRGGHRGYGQQEYE